MAEEVEKRVKEPIAQAEIARKNVFDKFKENFIKQDISVVKGKLVDDVIIPSIKKIVSDTISNGIDMILYGEVQGRGGRPNGGTFSNVMFPYNSIYDNKGKGGKVKPQQNQGSDNSQVYEYGKIVVGSMEQAKAIIRQLKEMKDIYGNVRVADLYDLGGLAPNSNDNRYGWTDVSSITFRMLSDGRYLIVTPPVELLQSNN
jgi:hypothetical protein